MALKSSNETILYWIILIFFMGIVFILDRISLARHSVCFLYTLPVVMGVYLLKTPYLYFKINFLAAVLIFSGFLVSPMTADMHQVSIINRILAILVIMSCSFIALRHVQSDRIQQELEAAFMSALENAPYGILMVDSTGKIVFSNEQAEKMFCYSSGELMQKSIDHLVPEEIRSKHSQYSESFLMNPHNRAMGINQDLFGLRKNGEKVPVEIGLTPVKSRKGLMVMSSILDLTERKRFERELERTNRIISQKNKELEEFVHTVSHDLKAPLVSISGFAQLISTSGELKQPDNLNYLSRLEASVFQMEDLLKDLLTLTRVSQRELETNKVSLGEIVNDTLRDLDAQIKESQAEIELLDPVSEINVHKTLFSQVFTNLISNSIKYHRPGIPPKISISTSSEKEDSTLILVQDNGIGIHPSFREKVFKIFERLTNDQSIEGTGIGLAIVKKIVSRHKGVIWIEQGQPFGSVFKIEIPKNIEKESV